MNKYLVDLSLAPKYFLPLAIILFIFSYLFFRKIFLYFWQATESQRVKKQASNLREPAAPKQVIVRKTDLYSQLNSQQRKVLAFAEKLEKEQKWIEAAKLFDSIGYQRKAIDILEQHGFIDEACTILFRMGVPYRAAIVYERNGHYQKSATIFSKLGQHESAARSFEKLALLDYNFYRKVAEAYLEAGIVEKAIKAYDCLQDSDAVLKLCLARNCRDLLLQYLALPFHARALLPQMSQAQVQDMIQALPLNPQSVAHLSHWVLCMPERYLIQMVLTKLSTSQELAKHFWGYLDDRYLTYICKLWLKDGTCKPDEGVLRAHAAVLQEVHKAPFAQDLLASLDPPTTALPA